MKVSAVKTRSVDCICLAVIWCTMFRFLFQCFLSPKMITNWFRMWRQEFPLRPQVCGCWLGCGRHFALGLWVFRPEMQCLLAYVCSGELVARDSWRFEQAGQRTESWGCKLFNLNIILAIFRYAMVLFSCPLLSMLNPLLATSPTLVKNNAHLYE